MPSSDVTNSSNYSSTPSGFNASDTCGENLPATFELLAHLPIEGYVLTALLVLFSLLTLGIYIDEIIFIRKRIRRGTRTMWVLACYPVYSITSLLSVFFPRCGVVNDMIASGFFATCLYNFSRLMVRYMGGTRQLWKLFQVGRPVSFRTVPICCCCFCFPLVPFRMSVYNAIRTLVLQVAIIRPILTFIAVMLYIDGTFHPSKMGFRNPYTYIMIGDAVSTMLAVYGMMILRGIFRPELEHQFKLSGKVMAVQLALILSVVPNIIIGILVANDIIQCGALFPSKGRGEMIYHSVIVLIMLPLSLVGRRFFRRSSDGNSCFDQKSVEGSPAAEGVSEDRSKGDDVGDNPTSGGVTTLPFMIIDGETNV